MAVVYTKLLFLNSTQTLVNTLSHTTAHRIQLIIYRRQPKSQRAMPHYTPLHNLLPVSPYPHNRRHYIFHYPSSLLFLPLDVLALTPPSPNTYPRTYHTRESRPLGAVTMVPPVVWSLVDNKRNTHTCRRVCVYYCRTVEALI